jgi:CheY-like chemotaxis protein
MTNPDALRGTLLIVEDEPMLRRLVERSLVGAGYRVLPAGDGVVALATLSEHGDSLDAVYLDLSLPGMRGEAVFERVRTLYPTLPVVIASGGNPPAGIAVGAGATVFLPKPFLLADLCDLFARMLAPPGVREGRLSLQLALGP